MYTHYTYRTYTYVHIHTYTCPVHHTYIHTCMYACMHACMHACIYTSKLSCVHVHKHACKSACMHMYMQASMYVCMYACMCLLKVLCLFMCNDLLLGKERYTSTFGCHSVDLNLKPYSKPLNPKPQTQALNFPAKLTCLRHRSDQKAPGSASTALRSGSRVQFSSLKTSLWMQYTYRRLITALLSNGMHYLEAYLARK